MRARRSSGTSACARSCGSRRPRPRTRRSSPAAQSSCATSLRSSAVAHGRSSRVRSAAAAELVHVGFVIGGIPSLGHSGSTLASWTILETLLGAGHEVTAVLCPAGYLLDETVPERLAALERLGATVRVVDVPDPGPVSRSRFVRSLLAPADADLLPAARVADGVAAALGQIDAGVA